MDFEKDAVCKICVSWDYGLDASYFGQFVSPENMELKYIADLQEGIKFGIPK